MSIEEYQSVVSNETELEIHELECSEDFYRENGSSICIPSCHTWAEISKDRADLNYYTIISSAVIGFLICVADITLSCIYFKRL